MRPTSKGVREGALLFQGYQRIDRNRPLPRGLKPDSLNADDRLIRRATLDRSAGSFDRYAFNHADRPSLRDADIQYPSVIIQHYVQLNGYRLPPP